MKNITLPPFEDDELSDDILKVVETYMFIAHDGQVRKNTGEAYINHPVRIANVVGKNTNSFIMTAAAALHDTVEDSDGEITLDMIRDYIDPRVAEIVDALTKREGEEYNDYIERVLANPHAKHIKRVDILDNLTDLPFDSKRYAKYISVLSRMIE